MKPDVSAVFNKYTNREVNVTGTPWEAGGYKGVNYNLDKDDATIAEIKAEAAAYGLRVSTQLPDQGGAAVLPPANTLFVHIGKSIDQKWRILSIN